MKGLFVAFWGLLLFGKTLCADTELVIFSYDRAMQLYALLESISSHTTGLDRISVLCRSSHLLHNKAYKIVEESFPHLNVKWHYQGHQPKNDFQKILLNIVENSASSFITFAVDDMIVTEKFSFEECEKVLNQNPGIYAFYLRLGKNICESDHGIIPNPPFQSIKKGADCEGLMWKLTPYSPSSHYWSYPHTVDMAVFRKEDVLSWVRSLSFANPNIFESVLTFIPHKRTYGACFEHSKVVNIPANKVNKLSSTKSLDEITVKEMLRLFLNRGKKINIMSFYQMNNSDTHEFLSYDFIDRL